MNSIIYRQKIGSSIGHNPHEYKYRNLEQQAEEEFPFVLDDRLIDDDSDVRLVRLLLKAGFEAHSLNFLN